MFKEVNKYIFSFRLLRELDKNLIHINLEELLCSKSPSEVFVTFDQSRPFDSRKDVLIGKGFNFDRIEGEKLDLILSENEFKINCSLVKNVIRRFKNRIIIDDSCDKYRIYNEIIKCYCGKIGIPLFQKDIVVLLKICPLSYLSSLKEKHIVVSRNRIIKDIAEEDIFIDDLFLYFYFENVLYKISKEKVNLI